MELSYRLAPRSPLEPDARLLRNADEMSLRYSFFLGDVALRSSSAELSAQWGWVPLFDFSLSLNWICRELELATEPTSFTFEFTESEATLQVDGFTGSTVRISASYATGIITVAAAELADLVANRHDELVRELYRRWPALSENAAFRDLTAPHQ